MKQVFVVPISQVCPATMLVVFMKGIKEYDGEASNGMVFIPMFTKIR
jgi:hypothetical protein